MEQEMAVVGRLRMVKEQFAKLQQAADEALWEDFSDSEEENESEKEMNQDIIMMEGREVKKGEVHDMLHFAKSINLMSDVTTFQETKQ